MIKKTALIDDAAEFLGSQLSYDISKDKPLEQHDDFDSFSVIQFVLFIENKYKIRFTKSQINNMQCFNDLEKSLQEKLLEK